MRPASGRPGVDELAAQLKATQAELNQSNTELLMLTNDLDATIADRTRELEETQAELQRSNTELLMLTNDLDVTIVERTAELTAANVALQQEIEEVERARAQLRRSTERLELAARAAGLGVWEWDVAADELVWDDTTFRLYGVVAGEFSDTGSARRARLHPADRASHALTPESPMLAEPTFQTQFRVIGPDGTTRVLAATGLVVTGVDGAPTRVVGIDQDITERVRVAEELDQHEHHLQDLVDERTTELRDAVARADSANRAKSVFLANMSHELRTPMNAILGFTDLLRNGDLSSEKHDEYVSIIGVSGRHLLELINDVLDMAKIESGRIEFDASAVDVAALAGEVVELLHDRALHRGLALELHIASDLPQVIRTDELKLRQILLNLVGNAIKCTPEGHVSLTVSGSQEAPGGAAVLRFEAADTGVGIAPTDQERIFEPFQQIGDSPEGTGLGLPISRSYAELMGGTLTVHSALGQGSVFLLSLPVVESQEIPVPTDSDAPEVVGLEPGQSVRVLIVEDEKENALLLQVLMERVGIEAAMAVNGAAAVEAFPDVAPDLVWMDRRMPAMDGIEATRRIRALDGGDHVVIVGVTASVFADQRASLLAAGMNAVITKPFAAQEIYGCMERLLGVRFRYGQPVGAAPPPQVKPSAADLARLPQSVLDALADALTLLDPTAIAEAVEKVAAVDPVLGDSLRVVTEHLGYQSILAALDELTP